MTKLISTEHISKGLDHMNTATVSQLADNVTDVLTDVVGTGRDVAHGVGHQLPDVTDTVGRFARSSADSLTDLAHDLPGQMSRAASTMVALAPFVHRSTPRLRRRSTWLGPIAVLVVIAGFVIWRRSHRTVQPSRPATTDPNVTSFDRAPSAASA